MTAHPACFAPDEAGLAAAIEAIRRGQPIIVPTDTVYGLAVLADDPAALDVVFSLKHRPAERSIAVLVADLDQVNEIAVMHAHERRIAERRWPGPLTLVLPLRQPARLVGAPDNTIGVRCPNEAFVQRLARVVGPLATTSANRSGEPTPTAALDAAAVLDGEVAVVIDDGPRAGQASTVARVSQTGEVTVFRQGELTRAELEDDSRG